MSRDQETTQAPPTTTTSPTTARSADGGGGERAALRSAVRGLPLAVQLARLAPDAGGGGSADVHRVAEAGLAGSGGALPHQAQIQRSFGAHDISSVRAHSDGAAQTANQQLGAAAYASGERIALGRGNDLHTVAHEAAHVVQQRRGVSLPGGVGAAGDTYERQADAVADRVVRGQPAGDLLGAPTGATAAGAVQRKTYNETLKTGFKETEESETKALTIGIDALDLLIGQALPDATALGTLVEGLIALEKPAALAQLLRGHKKYADTEEETLLEVAQEEVSKVRQVREAVATYYEELQPLGRSAVWEVKGFLNFYGGAKRNLEGGLPLAVFVTLVTKFIQTARSKRAPEIGVSGAKPDDSTATKPELQESMSEVEKRFDVLARKAAPRLTEQRITEVDLAFLQHMRGFPDIRVDLSKGENDAVDAKIEKGPEERVYAVGSQGAIDFEGQNANREGARLYGVLLPLGFVDRYGEDLRAVVQGKCARAPSEDEMVAKTFEDKGETVTMGDDKAFGIRSEKSTGDDGQVDVHHDRRVDLENGGKKSMTEFLRAASLGVVEFTDQGAVIQVRMW